MFQFTRPRGARPSSPTRYARSRVSIHAPARGATCSPTSAGIPLPSFNSRAREGRDQFAVAAARVGVVSIHAPARGATRAARTRRRSSRFQFTRPRGARRRRMAREPDPAVSIHAPARGATARRRVRGGRGGFNSRAREGRDPRRRGRRAGRAARFNSRAREGRDYHHAKPTRPQKVSIHAPARGATFTTVGTFTVAPFQFTRPRGARPEVAPRIHGIRRFNSRAREGRDTIRRTRARSLTSFNSRAREGRDVSRSMAPLTLRVFQFTRPRGARLAKWQASDAKIKSFNSRAREGRDGIAYTAFRKVSVSIHAPARGATRRPRRIRS